MSKNDNTSAIIDGVLRLTVTTGSLAAGLAIPNLLIALDKPLNNFWKHLDERQRERELRRVVSYMKSNQLVREDYKYGLQITPKGKRRLEHLEFKNLVVQSVHKWDGKWRLIIYDIPEEHKEGRKALTAKLNSLGFYQLQRSAWLHPFSCRDVIEIITSHYQTDKFVSYIETTYIDNQKLLIEKFKNRYSETTFE